MVRACSGSGKVKVGFDRMNGRGRGQMSCWTVVVLAAGRGRDRCLRAMAR